MKKTPFISGANPTFNCRRSIHNHLYRKKNGCLFHDQLTQGFYWMNGDCRVTLIEHHWGNDVCRKHPIECRMQHLQHLEIPVVRMHMRNTRDQYGEQMKIIWTYDNNIISLIAIKYTYCTMTMIELDLSNNSVVISGLCRLMLSISSISYTY